MDTWDLFDEIELPATNDAIRDEIRKSFSDHLWVRKNFYALRKDKALDYGWRRFVKVVKHRRRYVFAMIPPKKSLVPSDVPEPGEMLRQIDKVIREVGLITTIKAGTLVSRPAS